MSNDILYLSHEEYDSFTIIPIGEELRTKLYLYNLSTITNFWNM